LLILFFVLRLFIFIFIFLMFRKVQLVHLNQFFCHHIHRKVTLLPIFHFETFDLASFFCGTLFLSFKKNLVHNLGLALYLFWLLIFLVINVTLWTPKRKNFAKLHWNVKNHWNKYCNQPFMCPPPRPTPPS